MASDKPRSHQGRVNNDPLSAVPVGGGLPGRWVAVGEFLGASDVVQDVDDWDHFEGSLLAVGVREQDTFKIWGTAVMIAPGLVVSATHVLSDHMDGIMAGEMAALCIGVRSNGALDLWTLRTVSHDPADDLALLGVELASDLSPGWGFSLLPISTRAPRNGERLTIVGFRFEERVDMTGGNFSVEGALLCATGDVTAVSYPIHDRILKPYPTIEIQCGSLGGMSGGAVFDSGGNVLGIIARGMSHEDGRGPTYASWIVKALSRPLDIPWPPGLYQPQTQLLALPEKTVRIVGRDKARVTGPTSIEFEIWFG